MICTVYRARVEDRSSIRRLDHPQRRSIPSLAYTMIPFALNTRHRALKQSTCLTLGYNIDKDMAASTSPHLLNNPTASLIKPHHIPIQ